VFFKSILYFYKFYVTEYIIYLHSTTTTIYIYIERERKREREREVQITLGITLQKLHIF